MSSSADAAGDGAGEAVRQPSEPPEWLSLDDGETVEWVGQPATVSLIPALALGVLLLPVLGLGLLVILSAYLTVTHTDFVVTNTTLYHKRGVLSTNIESVGLDRIQNTEYSQSVWGKQFGYGTIEISTAGSSGSDVTFRSIEDPRPVRNLVTELANAAGGGDGTGGRGGHQTPGGDDSAPASPAGVDQALLEELLSELRAVNESMENVERLLREGREVADGATPGGDASGGGASGGDVGAGGAETASDFVVGGTAGTSSDADDDTPPSPFGDDGEE